MINGESYKWIVAEAAKKALGTERIQEHVFIVKLVNDKNDPNRVAGAVGFSVRDHKLYVYKFKACLLVAGGCVNIFRPRSVGEGMGRAWYPVWNAGSTYAMAAEAGRRADHDGEPLRARPLQGRLRPGRRLVPAVQVQGHQRLRRGVSLQARDPGPAGPLRALQPGLRDAVVPAQST